MFVHTFSAKNRDINSRGTNTNRGKSLRVLFVFFFFLFFFLSAGAIAWFYEISLDAYAIARAFRHLNNSLFFAIFMQSKRVPGVAPVDYHIKRELPQGI